MQNVTLFSFFALLVLVGFSSCVKTDFDEPPPREPANLEVDMTLAELKASIINEIEVVEEDLVVQGVVTSSDEEGNIFKQIYIEDETGGAVINIDVNEMHAFFPIGMQLFINLNGLAIHNDDGLLAIGGGIQGGNFPSVTRMAQAMADAAIAKGTRDNVVEPRVISLTDINNDLLGTLVRFEEVEFTDEFAGATYADALSDPPVTVNTLIADCDNNSIIVRNSGYSSFANETTPQGNGTITALLSKFAGDYQLFIRDINDVDMTGERCDGGGGGGTISDLEANTTIEALWGLHTEGNFEVISSDLIIEGTVVSNDEEGNFFKELYIQDATAGVHLKLDAVDMYQDYPVGRTIFVKLNGLTLGDEDGALAIGSGVDGDLLLRIEENTIGQYVELGEMGEATPTTVTIPTLNNNLLNQLVRLEDVQFVDADAGQSYADGDNLFSLNRTIEDCENTITLRTSGYADFANSLTPQGRGSIVAVLSIYQGDYQLFIRDINDVDMTGERCDGGGGGGDVEIDEGFDTIADDAIVDLDGWYNIAEVGSNAERWFGGEFQGAKYAEASAYQSVDSENIIWLITPAIELDATKTLTFQSNQHHWATNNNGQLSVWVANDFDGSDTESANWVEIDCNLPTASNSWYEWVNSGTITLNDYFAGGMVHVGFRYEGQEADDVTGFQLDNVRVEAQ